MLIYYRNLPSLMRLRQSWGQPPPTLVTLPSCQQRKVVIDLLEMTLFPHQEEFLCQVRNKENIWNSFEQEYFVLDWMLLFPRIFSWSSLSHHVQPVNTCSVTERSSWGSTWGQDRQAGSNTAKKDKVRILLMTSLTTVWSVLWWKVSLYVSHHVSEPCANNFKIFSSITWLAHRAVLWCKLGCRLDIAYALMPSSWCLKLIMMGKIKC